MPQDVPYEGVVGRTLDDSTPWWPPLPSAPDGTPNVVMVLLDDVGYAQFGCYGSDIATPTFDRLARDGLRYSNFHTTALCSPTRACLLTGRNHHSNGMGRIVEFAQGFPGYDATIPKANGMLSEVLARSGLRQLRGREVALDAGAGDDDGRVEATVAARPRLRSFLWLHGGRDRPVPPGSRARQPPGRSARHAGDGLPPHRGPRRPRDRVSSTICAQPRPTSRSSSTSRPVLATRRTKRRASTSRSTAVASTTAGIDGATKSFARQVASALLPEGTQLFGAAALDPGLGLARHRRATAVRPHDGGLRRVPRAHRRAGRPCRRPPRARSVSSTTQSCW